MLSLSTNSLHAISKYMSYTDVVQLSCTNKEANSLMSHELIWEEQCRRYFHTKKNEQTSFKVHFQYFIEMYGKSAPKYFKRILRCWRMMKIWAQQYLPLLLTTLNDPANQNELQKLKNGLPQIAANMIENNDFQNITPYLIWLGECCNGQNRTAKLARMGMYGYYEFYGKASSCHMLSINDAIALTQEVLSIYGRKNADVKNLWLFSGGLPTRNRLITVPCLTFINLGSNGEISKIIDNSIVNPKHGNANSFMDHLEWYLSNLLENNYRITENVGILRFPKSDVATSECVTKGVLVRASPIFIPEVSSIKNNVFIFPYHIEIECPNDEDTSEEMRKRCFQCPERATLTMRKWRISDGDKVEKVEGPGVIGMYPSVFVGQELFSYESCSRQSKTNGGRMWGWFVFKDDKNDLAPPFELELKPYKLDWDCCQWI